MIIVNFDGEIILVEQGKISGGASKDEATGRYYAHVTVTFPGVAKPIVILETYQTEFAKAVMNHIADSLAFGATLIRLSDNSTLKAYDDDETALRAKYAQSDAEELRRAKHSNET